MLQLPLVKPTILACLFFLVFSGKETMAQVPFNMGIFKEFRGLKKVNLNIYQDTALIHSEITKSKEVFFVLPANSHCVVELSKEGYQSKFIVIDTYVDQQYTLEDIYGFEVDLVKTKDVDTEVYGSLPAAIIRYDRDMGKFYYDRTYSRFLQLEAFKY